MAPLNAAPPRGEALELYVVRHAHADPAPTDAVRPLSRGGREAFTALVRRLDRLPARVALVAASPYVRAQQTAQVLCEARNWQAAESWPELRPDTDPQKVVARLLSSGATPVVLVAHQPLVGRLVHLLAHRDTEFQPGTIAHLVHDGGSRASLRWTASP